MAIFARLKLVQDTQNRLGQLMALVEKSATFVKLLKEQMDLVRTKESRPREKPKSSAKPKSSGRHAKKRALVVSDSEEERETKRVRGSEKPNETDEKASAGTAEEKREAHAFVQPALVTGATLKDYQLEGVAWMAGLYGNGISGILGAILSMAGLGFTADELHSGRNGSRQGEHSVSCLVDVIALHSVRRTRPVMHPRTHVLTISPNISRPSKR